VQIDNPRGKGLLGDEHHVEFKGAYCLFQQTEFFLVTENPKSERININICNCTEHILVVESGAGQSSLKNI